MYLQKEFENMPRGTGKYQNEYKLGGITYLVDCGRDPKHLPVGIDEHIRFVADLVIAVGAE